MRRGAHGRGRLESRSHIGAPKVLALVGSPRKGHTYALVQRIGELLPSRQRSTSRSCCSAISTLRPCRGCYHCQSHGEHRCPLKDGALRALTWFRFTGFDIVAKVGWSVWPSPRVEWKRTDRDDRTLRRAAARLWHAMQSPRRGLSLAQVVQFYVGQTTPATDPDFFVADDRYHHDLDAVGFHVAPWKRAVGRVAFSVVSVVMSRRLGARPPRRGAAVRPPP